MGKRPRPVPAQRYIFAVSDGEAQGAGRGSADGFRRYKAAAGGREGRGHGRLPEHGPDPGRA